ncbi:hypothetical protein BDY21DRAFT_256838, partial [Lineolata rhizophorae]
PRRRRRRRRAADRPPVSARLLLDERMKGDAGILSHDLVEDLFPGLKKETTGSTTADSTPPILHVAISPWIPSTSSPATDIPWTILAARPPPSSSSSTTGSAADDSARPHSSLQFRASSPALQSFARTLQAIAPSHAATARRDAPLEIRILDAAPVPLSAVYVTLDVDALRRADEVQAKFGGGFGGRPGRPLHLAGATGAQRPPAGRGKGAGADEKPGVTPAQLRAWMAALRAALRAAPLVHAGDEVPLPLPAHPITHVPAPPARVTACEPVAQGRLRASSRVVVLHVPPGGSGGAAAAAAAAAGRRVSPTLAQKPIMNGTLKPTGPEEDDADDTSTEQFYSAAEERGADSTASSPPTEESDADADASRGDESDASSVVTEDSSGGNLSDDPDDMISLNAPALATEPASGALSAFTSATPRARYTNGIATPGSVFSAASTVRGGGGGGGGAAAAIGGKVFKAQGLLERVPEELLHPRPGAEEDEEARVYVDTSALVKLGVFSGDWVRVEGAAEPAPAGSGLDALEYAMMGMGLGGGRTLGEEEEEREWRAVKVYGLPEALSRRPQRYAVHRSASAAHTQQAVAGHRRSMSHILPHHLPRDVTPRAHLSPLLLANLGSPSHLRISFLSPPPPPPPPSGQQQFAGRHHGHKSHRIPASASPPFAREMELLNILTPFSTNAFFNPVLFSALRQHMEGKRRIVKRGDVFGVPVDEALVRSLVQGAGDEEANSGVDEMLAKLKGATACEAARGGRSVAWFKVGNVGSSSNDAEQEGDDEATAVWGGVYSVDSVNTTTKGRYGDKGGEKARLPGTMESTWPYYLGLRRAPPMTSSQAASAEPSKYGNGLPEPPRPYVSPLRRQLRELLSAATSPRALRLHMPPLAVLLTSTQRGVGKATLAAAACEDLGLHSFALDAYDALAEGAGAPPGDAKTAGLLEARVERALLCGKQNTVVVVRHVDALAGASTGAAKVAASLKEKLAECTVLIATTSDVDKVPDEVRALFTHEFEMGAPDEGEREGLLRDIVAQLGVRLAADVELGQVAIKTAALVAGDLVDVVERAVVARRERLEGIVEGAAKEESGEQGVEVKLRDVELAGGASTLGVTKADFDAAVDAARKNFADAIGAPKIPSVSWSDVGGLAHVKAAVIETIQLPLTRPELFARGMKKRSGILFYGPPGTGKTLLAKAIATEFSLNFFSVKGPELLNMYIGESEANVRRVFRRARDARPCVVFFDELDSVAPKRGNQGDSGGVMDRIVSQLLAELDGMSEGEEGAGGVFVIGATNRPDLLDQALLRPGRFDKMLFLGVADTHDKQRTILEALTRKFTLDPSLSLARIAASLPFTYTGADLYALCSDAMLKAITRQATHVDEKVAQLNREAAANKQRKVTVAHFFDHIAQPDDVAVVVTEDDFVAARKELVPSVSVQELAHYDRVRKAFEGEGRRKEEEQ